MFTFDSSGKFILNSRPVYLSSVTSKTTSGLLKPWDELQGPLIFCRHFISLKKEIYMITVFNLEIPLQMTNTAITEQKSTRATTESKFTCIQILLETIRVPVYL